MLEHFKAGDDIELTGVVDSKLFGCRHSIVNFDSGFQLVQPRDLEWLFSHVDARNLCPQYSQRFRQDAAAAADIECPATFEIRVFSYPVEAQRVDGVQWPEFSMRIPPARRQGIELGNLGCIHVLPACRHPQLPNEICRIFKVLFSIQWA